MMREAKRRQDPGQSTSRRADGRSGLVIKQVDRQASSRGSWSASRRYAVVVDAGSSGSRMQVYSWKDPLVDRAQREREGLGVKVLPKVEKGTWEGSGRDWQMKVEPGLSTFGEHPEDVSAYLKRLFDHARSIIPPEAVNDTPVYVLATAGMRLLENEKRDAVLQATCSYIQDHTPFKLGAGGCADHVQVISGEEEGLLGWIAINYLMDGFHFKSHTGDDQAEAEGRSTFGFLDMGGASTQIAFEPSQKHRPNLQDDLTPISLRMLDGTDVSHNVFVTTFLGFGTNRAHDRYLEKLMHSSTPAIEGHVHADSDPVQDPCLPKGMLKPSTKSTHASLVGTGRFDQCLKSLAPLLNKEASCAKPPCLFHGVHVPPIDFNVNHFIGVSEYWFSSNDVFHLGGAYDFVSFQKAAEAYCGTPWDLLKSQLSSGSVFGGQVTAERLEMQCFKSAWMATVLHDGIGLPRITDPGGKGDGRKHADDAQVKADAKNLFQSVNDVNGLAVSWTLGKAVLEASKDIPPVPSTSGPHGAPVHGEVTPPAMASSQASNSLQGKLSPTWQRPSEVLRQGQIPAPSALAVFCGVLIAILFFISCICLRGRNARAIKRRTLLRDFVKAPCRRQRPGHGDYTLASMEEGGGSGINGHRGVGDEDIALGSDSTSGEDDSGFPPSTSRHQKRRRSSANGILTTILIPLQRLGLALGIKSSFRPSSIPPHSHASRRIALPRYAMRHNATVLPVSMSQPTSPKAFSAHVANGYPSASSTLSRPSSRASPSPRLLHDVHSEQGTYFGQRPSPASLYSSSALNSTSVTATASQRSSRAASPIFGHSANSVHHSGTLANGRLTPSSRSASSGFARKAWEDSD